MVGGLPEMRGRTGVKCKARSFAVLIDAYKYSPEWSELSEASRRDYGRYLDMVKAAWGKLQVAGVEPRHVLALRMRKRKHPQQPIILSARSLRCCRGAFRGDTVRTIPAGMFAS